MATNETIYRGFRIVPTDPVPPIPNWRDHAVTWVHVDYDGPEDRRIGTCANEDAARADIDEWIGENDCPIETIKLTSTVVARPTGSLGNVGFSPRAWVAGYGDTADAAVRDFYASNPNW